MYHFPLHDVNFHVYYFSFASIVAHKPADISDFMVYYLANTIIVASVARRECLFPELDLEELRRGVGGGVDGHLDLDGAALPRNRRRDGVRDAVHGVAAIDRDRLTARRERGRDRARVSRRPARGGRTDRSSG